MKKLEKELLAWLSDQIQDKAEAIVNGVDIAVYKERCAEIRMLRAVVKALPDIMKKASE